MINHYHFARGGCDENVRTMGFPVLIVNIEAAVPSVPQNQKETTNLTNKEKNRASVYCLCPKCRAMFFSAKKFYITRVDPYQVEKDDCTFCQTGAGLTTALFPEHPAAIAMAAIMTEKRMAGEYEIVQAISVGPTEIVLGYSPQNEDLPYMTAFCTQNELFTAYQHCIADDSYPHILGIFSERMTDAVKELERQLSAENKAAVDNRPYNHQKCLSTDQCNLVPHADDLHQKVVIIKPDVLKPEYQLATRQLYLCTGGFGASPNSRGSACFCTSLFSGKHSRFERSDILATLEADAVPKWAQEKLREALQSQQKKDKSKEAAR